MGKNVRIILVMETGLEDLMLILSLFPGIGLLDMAFEELGFCIVRGPDLIWGGDIQNFHPPQDRFDGVIGGPPCQAHSELATYPTTTSENLIPEFERCVTESRPGWFLMENVKRAPIPRVAGYQVHSVLINNRIFGEEQNRVRRFSFGTPDGCKLVIDASCGITLFENPEYEYCVTAHDHTGSNWEGSRRGKGRKWREMARLQGLPEDWDIPAFRRLELGKMIGNGVPLPMGRAVARAVARAIDFEVPAPLHNKSLDLSGWNDMAESR